MKCPYRLDKNGDFKECYGNKCMAYFEYDTGPFLRSTEQTCSVTISSKTTAKACKKMALYAPASNYCV